MRIEPGALFQRYQAYGAAGRAAEPSSVKPEGPANTDKVSLSEKAAGRGEFDRQLRRITGEIEAGASPARLQALQEKIERNEYRVSAQDLANAMLGFLRS